MEYTKKHIIAIASALIIALIGVLLSNTYRPYIYENQLFDFHIADTIGSWVSVPAGALFLWGLFRGKSGLKKTILISVTSCILYEFTLSTTVDFWDVVVAIISGSFTLIVYVLYKNKTEKITLR